MEVERQEETRLSIVDAVAQSVIKLDAKPALYTVLDHQPTVDLQAVGFRPLACPNCGWDLPVRPDDIIFICSSCNRAWQIYGSDLYEVSCQVAEVPSDEQPEEVKYLPFWVLRAERDKNSSFQYFLPAFRYRRLKLLADLTRNLSRRQPSYSVLQGKKPAVYGCYYDQEDAVRLAQFIYAGLTLKHSQNLKAWQEDKFSEADATLTWFPFKRKGHYLLDPFTGLYPLQSSLL